MGSGGEEPVAPLPAYHWQRLSDVQGVSHDTDSDGSMPEFQAIDTFAPTGKWDQGSDTDPFPYRMTIEGIAISI